MTVPLQQDLDDAYSDWLAELRERNQREKLLIKHRDCRDPDHPGCHLCMPIENAPRRRPILTLKKKVT